MIWKVLSALVVLSLGCGVLGPIVGPAKEPGLLPSGTDWRPLSEGEISAVGADLPQDPARAAAALVEVIHGEDERAARAATGELLRRAGLPLVSIEGPVVAAPDGLILGDTPVYIELIDGLTQATRRGAFYSPADLAELLAAIGFSQEPLPPEALIEALGQWAKTEAAPEESIVAAAAVRSLAARRGEVLYAGADPERVQIDPLQTMLILAHVSSRNWVNAPEQSSPAFWDRLAGVEVAYAQEGACGDLNKLLDVLWEGGKPPAGFEWLHSFNKDTTKGVITGAIEKAIEARSEAGAARFGKGMLAFDIINKAFSAMLLLMGAQIEVEANTGEIHFHHADGDHSRSHAEITATAKYESPISGEAVQCYSLIGVQIPENKPLEGFKVQWEIYQPKGNQMVAPISAHSHKIDHAGNDGEVLGAAGTSVLQIYSATETEPEVGAELQARVLVVAELDKSEIPFALADLWDLTNPGMFALKKSIDVVIAAIQRAGLPRAQVPIEVEYHGKDIYLAHGAREMFGFYVNLPLEVYLWTCEGVEGQWHAFTSYGVAPTVLEPVFQDFFGRMGHEWKVPENYSNAHRERFFVNPHQENLVLLHPQLNLTASVRFDRVPEVGAPKRGTIGEAEVLIGGHSFGAFEETGGTPFSMPIKGLTELDVCPGGESKMGVE